MQNNLYSQFACPGGVTTITNELAYSINTSTNEIAFNLACDPCLFESGETVNCECHRECDIDYDQCYDDCIDNGGGILALVACLDACRINYKSCQNVCGEFERPVRTAETFGVAFQLWWTHSIVASNAGPPDETFVSPVLTSDGNNFVHNSTIDFMGGTISYCMNYQVFVQYDDGTCCNFVGSECFHKG